MNKKNTYHEQTILKTIEYYFYDNLKILELNFDESSSLFDLYFARVYQNNKKYRLDWEVKNNLNFRLDSTYDLIIIANVVDYAMNLDEIFHKTKLLCHNKTKLIISFKNYLWAPVSKLYKVNRNDNKELIQNWLSINDVKNLLHITGFDIYRNSRFGLVTLKIPLIASFLNKYFVRFPIVNILGRENLLFATLLSNINTKKFKNDLSCSIIIPLRNEKGNLKNAIMNIPYFGRYQEIIMVEGNSLDDSWNSLNDIYFNSYFLRKIIICKQDGRGKADAVRKGFEIATGDVLMILDADLTVDPFELPKFFNLISSGKAEFVNGCRLVYPMEKQAMRFLNVLGNKFFSTLFSWLLDQPLKDTLCGTKVMFRHDYLKLVKNRKFFGDFDPFGDFDLLFGAHKLNLKIVELPIKYRERKYGNTNISRFRHGFILLRMCLFAARKIKFI